MSAALLLVTGCAATGWFLTSLPHFGIGIAILIILVFCTNTYMCELAYLCVQVVQDHAKDALLTILSWRMI